MKKVLAALMVIALLAAFSLTAFAARSLTDDENRLVDALRGKELLGQKVTQADITAFENYLMGTEKALTAEEVDTIIAKIDEVIALIEGSGAKTADELTKEIKAEALGIVESALAIAGLSVSIESNANKSKVMITDKAGNLIIDREVIKKTGYELSASHVILISSIVLAAVSAMFVLARSRRIRTLFADIT